MAKKNMTPELMEAAINAAKIVQSIPEGAYTATEAAMRVAKEMNLSGNELSRVVDMANGVLAAGGVHDEKSSVKVKEKERKIPFITDDPEILRQYFGVKKPNTIEECVVCIQRLDEVQEIKERLKKNKASPGYTVRYHDLDIDIDDVEELDNFIRRMQAYIEAFQKLMPDYDVELVSKNLDYLLARHHVTRNQLEAALGLSRNYFIRVLNPDDVKRRMSVEVLNNVCRVFGVSVDRFLKDDLSRTMMTGISKAFRFIDNLIDMTERHRMHWKDAHPLMKTSVVLHDSFSAKGLQRKDKVDRVDYWEAEAPGGKSFLAHTVYESGSESYRLGIEDGERIHWLFETSDDVKGELLKHCRELHELIDKQKEEFYLSFESVQMIDNFMDAFDKAAANEGYREYMEKQLEDYREKLYEQSLDWQADESQRRYELEAERLESSEIEFDDEQLRKEIEDAVRQEAEDDIERQLNEEREKMMEEEG